MRAVVTEEPMTNDLSREMDTYNRLLPSLSADEGKFIVIVGDSVIGKFESYSDALSAGYAKVGLDPFLVKRIASSPVVSYFSREINPICHP